MEFFKYVFTRFPSSAPFSPVSNIYYKKKAPQTALKLLNGFRQTIEALDFMSEQHEIDEDEE